MPLTHANATRGRLDDPAGTVARLRDALAETAPGSPVAVLIHGYQYSLRDPARSPHNTLFGLGEASGWPRRLGYGAPGAPLCLSFGWESGGSIWCAYDRAAAAARALAELAMILRALAPTRRVTLMGHSLGARVACQAFRWMAPGTVDRAILMAGAEFTHEADAATSGPAGRAADFLNVTAAQNRPFDLALELGFRPLLRRGPALGRGMAGLAPTRWCDLSLSSPAAQQALARLGLPLGRPERRICHSSTYLTPGVFGLYRAALRDPALLPRLRAELPAPAPAAAPRLPRPAALPPRWPLPSPRQTPS